MESVPHALNQVTTERNIDKAKLRKGSSATREPVTEALGELRQQLQRRKQLDPELVRDLDRVEREYVESRDSF